jgi:Tol biopolymer transport system component
MIAIPFLLAAALNPSIVWVTEKTYFAGDVALSPDARLLAYTKNEAPLNSIWLREVNGVTSRQIVSSQEGGRRIAFAPDGKSIYFIRPDTAHPWVSLLYQVSLDGGVPRKLKEHVDTGVTFSPDGRQLAFLRHPGGNTRELITANISDGHERKIAAWDTEPGPLSDPAWSPQGDEIACVSSANLSFVSVRTGARRTVRLPAPVTVLAWPAQDGGVYVLSGDGTPPSIIRPRLYRMLRFSVSDGQWSRVDGAGAGYMGGQLAISPDGSIVAAAMYRSASTSSLSSFMDWIGLPTLYYCDLALVRRLDSRTTKLGDK